MPVVRRWIRRVLRQALMLPAYLLLMTFSGGIPRGKEIRPDHVAIYIRWSTDDQTTGTTLETQREGCEHYLKSQGWYVREDLIFIDDGYSGGNLDRPAMRRLRDLVQRNEVDCVVVLKIDRLSRNIVDAVDLVLREWASLCYIKSAREPIDTTTDLGRVIFGILAMFADFERSQIRDRTQSGKVRRIAAGKQMHGEPAYGYSLHPTEKGVWVENPEESPLVRRIFMLAAQGVTANRITRLLNSEGVRTRAGKVWSIRAVLHILHNRTYIGEVEYGATSLKPVDSQSTTAKTQIGRKTHKHTRRIINKTPIYQGPTRAVVPLIDHEMFELVQRRLTANTWQRQNTGSRALGSPYLLVGLAKCSCGGALVHKVQAGRRNRERGKEYRHYICHNTRNGTCTIGNGHIAGDVAEKMVEKVFIELFGLKEQRAERFLPMVRAATEDRDGVAAALRQVDLDLEGLDREEAKLQRDAREGKVSGENLNWLRRGIEKDRAEAAERKRELKTRLAELDVRVRSLQGTLDALDAVEKWDALETWQKRQILRMVLTDRITMVKPKGSSEITVQIPWAF